VKIAEAREYSVKVCAKVSFLKFYSIGWVSKWKTSQRGFEFEVSSS
jgi:hypothetical protein